LLEIIHLLEDDPVLYVAHEIPEIAHLSCDEFVARGTTKQVV